MTWLRSRDLELADASHSEQPSLLWLLYLGFLFMPITWGQPGWRWLWATLVSLPVFFALYFHQLGRQRYPTVLLVLAFALLCYAVQPFNPFANTYLTYAAAFAPLALPGLLAPLLLTAALLALLAVEVLLLGQPPLIIAISVLVCTVCCAGQARSEER